MKKTVTILALLALVATANATVRVFVTTSSDGYGLETPANHMIPTISTVYANGVDENGYDYADYYGVPGPIRPGTYPADAAPSGTLANPIEILEGDWAYIWLQFQEEAKSAKINGLQIAILDSTLTWDPNNPEPLPAGMTTTYYLCNNMGMPAPAKRWDGTATPPNYPEWHNNNPQVGVAVNAYGLQNLAADAPWDLYKGGTARMALLGAIDVSTFDPTKVYQIFLPQVNYLAGQPTGMAAGYFKFVPEPASLMLLGLAGLLIRRR